MLSQRYLAVYGISTPASPKMLHSNGVFLSPMETGDLTPCQQRGPFMTFSTSKPGSAARSRRLAYINELRRDHPISKLRESNKGIDDEFIKANERVLKAISSNEEFEKWMNYVYSNYDCSEKTTQEIVTLVKELIVSPIDLFNLNAMVF